MKNAYIKAISYYLPPKVVTNDDLIKEFPEWSVAKVSSRLGIDSRHVSGEGETATDMAVKAAERLFEEWTEVSKEDVDYIIFCTQSPDYVLPTSACLIQQRIGLRTHIGAFDYNLGCSGYVYGLSIAKGLIAAGIASDVLLLTSETYTKYLHQKDKSNRTIFGDAATATLVSQDGFAEIGNFSFGTDGSGGNNLIVRTGASRFPQRRNDLSFDEKGNPQTSDYLYMNGAEIFNFTLDVIPPLLDDLFLKNGISKSNIDLYVFHQANKYILDYVCQFNGIPAEKSYYYMKQTGNTVSSTIPIALYEAKREKRLKGTILLAGFGVGYSWGGTLLKCIK